MSLSIHGTESASFLNRCLSKLTPILATATAVPIAYAGAQLWILSVEVDEVYRNQVIQNSLMERSSLGDCLHVGFAMGFLGTLVYDILNKK